jgi:DNA helicase-2/ATP-dependent DNA helicase PcrA
LSGKGLIFNFVPEINNQEFTVDFIKELNSSQQAAVLNTEGPSLVVAGAGSGKTRVLTYRIAQLLSQGIPAYKILALTFTNKAAREMQKRISALVGNEIAANLWMGTFHSIFSKILRFEADKLGYTSSFTIYDTQDSKNLLKAIIKEMKLDDKVYKPNAVLGRISMAKNNLVVAQSYLQSARILSEDNACKRPLTGEIYKQYQQRCKQSDTMDFDDLLLQTNILFRDFPEILAKYQQKFSYILVDEYQDTNYAQYLIVKKLSQEHHNICVVGDDAQSIYSFRGARIENILNFKNDYPDYKLYKLEQNYRSTTTIVDAANCVISKNKEQIPKRTFSENEEGEKIKVLRALSDKEEGFQVTHEIFRLANYEQQEYSDFAILYRTNAQSRILEEALRKRNIPYKIYGGQSFYQRKEIKDLLAYFRLTVNQNDEEAFKRIVNYPRRGIGDSTIEKLQDIAGKYRVSLWTVLCNLNKVADTFNAGTIAKLQKFGSMIEKFKELTAKENAYDAAVIIARSSGIIDDLSNDETPEGVSRKENIQELLNGIKDFTETAYKEGQNDKLPAFLEGVALLTDQDGEKEGDFNKVTLMTIHASKGLEFANVFITGMEEELFPAQQCVSNPAALEEERRLFYVALTRAQKRVFMSYATSRYKNGQVVSSRNSRFIEEIDQEFLEGFTTMREEPSPFKLRTPLSSSIQKPSIRLNAVSPIDIPPIDRSKLKAIDSGTVVPGMLIFHPTFGAGKVLSLEGLGVQKKAKVIFAEGGTRTLLLKFAKLYMQEE